MEEIAMEKVRVSLLSLMLVLCFIAFALPNAAQAASVVTDPAAFRLAPGDYLQDFTGIYAFLGTGNIGFEGPTPVSTFAYTASAYTAAPYVDSNIDTTYGVWDFGGLTTGIGNDILVLMFTQGFPTGVGGYFFSADPSGNPDGGPITVGVSSDGTNFTTTTFNTATPGFVGFANPGGPPIKALELVSNGVSFPTIGSLDVGHAVPEPATFGLLGGALIAAGLFKRHSTC
jgi:hypothetical protein